jgi:hypothetical protein
VKYTFLRRFTAGFLDVILGFALGYLLHWRVGHYFATRAVATFHIGSPGTL